MDIVLQAMEAWEGQTSEHQNNGQIKPILKGGVMYLLALCHCKSVSTIWNEALGLGLANPPKYGLLFRIAYAFVLAIRADIEPPR